MTDYAAIELEPEARTNLIDELAAYSETDLLCYFAEEPKLYARQCALWEPTLAWVEAQIDQPITRTQGIIPVSQPSELRPYFQDWLSAMDDGELVAAAQMVTGLGSVMLTLALIKGEITLEEALEAARLDEEFQQEEWGEDEAIEAKLAEKAEKIRAAHAYVLALGV